MRAAPAVAALAAVLAACQVNVEGARCDLPGSASQCPSGQACGNDGTCSERASGCVSSAAFCVAGVDRRCSGTRREQCVDGGACGAWQLVEECGALLCDEAADVCRCPDVAAEVAVDPGAPALPDGKTANGAPEPAGCRLRSLGAGLAAARAWVDADANAQVIVRAVGAGGSTRTFSAATGESFPLDVPGRVTLTSDAATTASTYEILFDDASIAVAPVRLGAGATLARFTVRNAAGAAGKRAVVLACEAATAAQLDHVAIEGKASDAGPRLDEGVRVDGACGLGAVDVEVRGMTGAAIRVDVPDPATAVTLTRGTLGADLVADANGLGVDLRNGTLVVQGTKIQRNAGVGISGNESFSGTVFVEIADATIAENLDTGVVVRSPSAVKITGTTVFKNGATTQWGQGTYTPSRRCGGVVLWGAPPAEATDLVFERNRVYANSGDQMVVLGSSPAWALEPREAACADPDTELPLFNVFDCYDSAAPPPGQFSYRGVVSISANVNVRRAAWRSETPTQGAGGDVGVAISGAAVTFAPFCARDLTVDCASANPKP